MIATNEHCFCGASQFLDTNREDGRDTPDVVCYAGHRRPARPQFETAEAEDRLRFEGKLRKRQPAHGKMRLG